VDNFAVVEVNLVEMLHVIISVAHCAAGNEPFEPEFGEKRVHQLFLVIFEGIYQAFGD
jgi:hypothetical protein